MVKKTKFACIIFTFKIEISYTSKIKMILYKGISTEDLLYLPSLRN